MIYCQQAMDEVKVQVLPSHMMPPGARQPDLPPMHSSLGPALFRSTPAGDGPVPDAHERNAMVGHSLSAVDALLVALRSGLSCPPHALPCPPAQPLRRHDYHVLLNLTVPEPVLGFTLLG